MLELGDSRFMNILERAVGRDNAAAAAKAFKEPASVSVRLNPEKASVDFAERHFGKDIEKVPWSEHGFFLKERPQFTLDPLFHAGCYYVQDSSAMYVGSIFRNMLNRLDGLGRPVRVLDLCAAPGGKTTDLAASLRQKFGDYFLLVANEVMHGRASVLEENVSIWGDPNVVVTSADPKAFSKMEGFFDVILADVPCSGEGMFRKDPKSLEDWSEDVVQLCASRQKRIIADSWPALRKGGFLIYSTCTFEEAENDGNVEWAAKELDAEVIGQVAGEGIFKTRTGALLVPGFVRGEGQFVAALVKASASPEWRGGRTRKIGEDQMRYIPEVIKNEVDALSWLHPLRAGVALGSMKGKNFVPSADLALAIGEEPLRHIHNFEYEKVEVDRNMALRFLHRDGIFIEGNPKGFLMICFEGHPLGFVKNIGNRWNSLMPQERRIRINVENIES